MAISRMPRQLEIDQFYALLPAVNSKFKYIFPDAPVYSLASGDAAVGVNARSLNAANDLVCWLQVPPNVDNYIVHVWMAGAGVSVVPTVFSGTIPAGTKGLYEFKIPRANIVEGMVEVYADLTDPNTGHNERTPELKVKIDLEAPGGPVDPSGVQKNLALVTAELSVPGEIGAVDLQQGITFTVAPYPGMKQWDTIELVLYGVTLRKRLDNAADVNMPVVFTATAQDLTCFAGRASAEVYYRIVDELGNESQPSSKATFTVDYIQNSQAAPEFLDIDPSTGTISLSSQPGRDTRIRVSTSKLHPGEVVTLEWSLLTAKGTTLSGTLSESVISPSRDLTFEVPGNTGLTLEEGRLIACYTVPDRNRSSKAVAKLSGAVVDRPLEFLGDKAVTHTPGERYIILKGRAPRYPGPKSNGSYSRRATNGVPPYTYSSDKTSIATVDQNGLVVAADNGTATITAKDQAGAEASYTITFTGVRVVERAEKQVWSGQVFSNTRPEYHSLSVVQLESFWEQYRNDDPSQSVAAILGWPDTVFWSGDNYYVDGTAFVVNLGELNPDFRAEERRSGGTPLTSLRRVGWK